MRSYEGIPETENPETRDTVFYTALDLFSLHGYNGISIRRICISTGITVGTFYYYFKNKEALFLKILEYFQNQSRTNHSLDQQEIDNLFREKSASQIISRLVENYETINTTPEMLKLWRIVFMEQYRSDLAAHIILEESARMVQQTLALLIRLKELSKINTQEDLRQLAYQFSYGLHAWHQELLLKKAWGWDGQESENQKKLFIKKFCEQIEK